jgi:predicted transposase/invertase (TIGR01784 family)
MYDTVSKYLIENHSQDFSKWLLGTPISLTRLEPSELFNEPIRADAIILTGEENILHIEMQTSPVPEIPFRMLDYRTRLYRKFPGKQVKQVVIYLKKTNSDLVYQTRFEMSGTKHEFEVIRLWEQPTELFLDNQGLLPLAVLSNSTNPTETLRKIATIINQTDNPKTQSTIMAVTGVLAGLILDKQTISLILRRDNMKESVIYQEILEEGIEIGEQKGKYAIARNLLELGISISQVSQATGLSIAEIEKLWPKTQDNSCNRLAKWGYCEVSSWLFGRVTWKSSNDQPDTEERQHERIGIYPEILEEVRQEAFADNN